jgi:hypothetical protein
MSTKISFLTEASAANCTSKGLLARVLLQVIADFAALAIDPATARIKTLELPVQPASLFVPDVVDLKIFLGHAFELLVKEVLGLLHQ